MAAGAPAQAFEVRGVHYSVGQQMSFLEDPVGALDIEHLAGYPEQYTFVQASAGHPERFYSPVWLKLELQFHESVRDNEYVLIGRSDRFSEIKLYRQGEDGIYSELVTGNHYRADTRDIDAPNYAFSISSVDQTLYLRYQGGSGTEELPWLLIEKSFYEQGSYRYYLVYTALLSAIFALLLFNIVLALAIRRKAYGFYAAFVGCVFMWLLTHDGFGFYYLWPEVPGLNDRAQDAFSLASSAFRILAVLFFLDIVRCAPRWYRAGILTVVGLATVVFVVMLAGSNSLPLWVPASIWWLTSAFGLALCLVGAVRKRPLSIPLFLILSIPVLAYAAQVYIPFDRLGMGLWSKQLSTVGFVMHVVLFSVCIAAQIRMHANSHLDALHDSLTGLPQMTLLRERFEWATSVAQRHRTQLAVLYIDLDGFKQVNDTYGHAAGNHVLQRVALRLRTELRETDCLARLGGDEFVVLLMDVPEGEWISTLTQRLLRSITLPIEIESEGQVSVSASIGVTTCRGGDKAFEDILREADLAMYASKKRGKNMFSIAGKQAPRRATANYLTLVAE